MEVIFEKMKAEHGKGIIDIFNHYIINSFSAFPEKEVPYTFFDQFMQMTENYPAFTIIHKNKIVGFCFLHPYQLWPTFNECAEITYFLHKDFTSRGIGTKAFEKLVSEARKMGILTILACIASENKKSISFHEQNGFRECGRFEGIIKKHGRRHDLIWMQKNIEQ